MSNDIDKQYENVDTNIIDECLSLMVTEMVKPTSETTAKRQDEVRNKIDAYHDEKRLTNLVEFS